MRWAWMALALCAAAVGVAASAAEPVSDEGHRALYSNRFTFTREGLPLVTVELMSGQKVVRLAGSGGLVVLPSGEGGPEVRAGEHWRVTVEDSAPAKVRYWTVVSRDGSAGELARWKQRGFAPQTFEIGVVFGIKGDVLDTRETLVAVEPTASEERAQRTARALAEKHGVETSVYPELLERPRGVLVAKNETSGAEVRGHDVLWFAPADRNGRVTVKDVVHGGGGSQRNAERTETRSYFGQVYVTVGTDGLLTVVNAVPEDRLLEGLVPSEIFPEAHMEALKAQAVAARSDLLAKIGTRHFVDPYLVCSSQHCQVYGGAGAEHPRTSKAVAATRGEVLVRDGGGLVDARYSAACGGHTENNENIWDLPADPSLRGRLDAAGGGARALSAFRGGVTEDNLAAFLAARGHAFCAKTRYSKNRYRWTVHHSDQALDALVAERYPHVGHVRDIRPGRRGVSGRILDLEIIGTRGKVQVHGELTIRRLFGGLKSSLFALTHKDATWTFDGAGFGHGVGMCQTGAIGMAESRRSYKQILQHYYRGTTVRKLY